MKKVFLIIFSISLLIISCEKNSDLKIQEYKILTGACGKIILDSKIGNNFNTAQDSLEKLREPLLTGGCPETPCYNYYMEIDTLAIDFYSDSRKFLGIIFKNSDNDLSVFSMNDVLDTYGNYYKIKWCDD